jgi:8-oxo-dGTP pyrophosphatase MutT (NUDIX family)
MSTQEQPNPDLPIFNCFGSVRVMAFNEQGAVLFVRRSAGEQQGLWELVGGKQEHPEEPPMETAMREFGEEAGPLKPITLDETVYELPSRKFQNKEGIFRTIFPKILFGITDNSHPQLDSGEHDRSMMMYPRFATGVPEKFTLDALAAVDFYLTSKRNQS